MPPRARILFDYEPPKVIRKIRLLQSGKLRIVEYSVKETE